jgi:endogenous inhibitor of DNA gyrase (YacG/DUF329 family)
MSRTCPECAKPTVEKYRPFCSKRCADLDLGRWLNGTYAIPVHEEDSGIRDTDESVDRDNLIR